MNSLHLHLSNLNHNYKIIREKLDSKTQLIGVVKANVYGVKNQCFIKRLIALGVDYLAVAYAKEGEDLRENGIKIPILVFYPQHDELEKIIDAKLEPCLYNRNIFQAFKKIIRKKKVLNYPIHIKYNTGLNRLGFSPQDTAWVIKELKNSLLRLVSVYSHLAASEETRPSSVCVNQIKNFKDIQNKHLKETGIRPKFHLLNSSGVFNYPEFQFDMVRCGIAFHGYANNREWDSDLKPVAALNSKISQIHFVKKGELVGYDNGWRAPQDSRIATLPIGHADGIGRHYGHQNGKVLINGEKAPIVGNICMDLLMVNVTSIECKEMDNATFFNEIHSAADFAESGNSISYELLSNLGPRIVRVVHNEK